MEERSAITSVGIDIGTSTSQVVFATLTLENTAGYFSVPHIAFAEKEVTYRSPIVFTPLSGGSTLDGEGIRRIVTGEYDHAGVRPSDIDTGAVIITGESARKENAAIVSASLAGLAGEFVVSTAGPDLEAVIAGKGSGAARVSKERGIVVANLDIGGGTTNIAFFDCGETIARGCLDIGGRLVRVEGEPDRKIAYVSESALRIARDAGVEIRQGGAAEESGLARVCERMAALLEEVLGLRPRSALLDAVRTPGSTPLDLPGRLDAICLSGGVADCVGLGVSQNPFRFGDIGPLLGAAIAKSALCSAVERVAAAETIRATVVGAGIYATSVSGSTILQRADLLPMKNLPALKLSRAEAERCYEGDADFLAGKLSWFLAQSDVPQPVLALDGDPDPSYERLKRLASCITEAANRALAPGTPLVLATRSDTAKALGQTIESLSGGARPVICIDDVLVEQGDYVDLGRPMMDGLVLPVVVKTLAFG